ncbi:hypothetical protein DFH27DRAFT_510977 [Peziza echinospora]|nr:hypothetical protein DFH27DRAFT_510977 [Peziza echinospora]
MPSEEKTKDNNILSPNPHTQPTADIQYGDGVVQPASLFPGPNRETGISVNGFADQQELRGGSSRLNSTPAAAYYTKTANQRRASSSDSGSDTGVMINEPLRSPSRVQKDRVSEYEASGGATPLRGSIGKGKGKEIRDSVQFVVKKTQWTNNISPVAKFPNELWGLIFTYLDSGSLFQLSLVSRRFHSLVTSPHTWRSVFAKHFPGQLPEVRSNSPMKVNSKLQSHDEETLASYSSERRYFTRLNAQPTWKKEYLFRTSLLRSLSRGRAYTPQYVPTNTSSAGSTTNAGSIITYPGCIGNSSVTLISATFPPIERGNTAKTGIGSSSLRPHLLHASYDIRTVASSDPTTGRIDITPNGTPPRPNLDWPNPWFPAHVPGVFLGHSLTALSEELGCAVGETVPGGRTYVELKGSPVIPEDQFRGKFLERSRDSYPQELLSYISALWIAKRRHGVGIFDTTQGRCGILVGESKGRVSMYSLPTNMKQKQPNTSWTSPVNSWLVSPGVPIIGIKADDEFSTKRQTRYRRQCEGILVVAVNALGEVYYLRSLNGPWKMIPQTGRLLNPLSGWDEAQMKALSSEKAMMDIDWTELKHGWQGWGMDYFIEVDFANANVILGKKGSRPEIVPREFEAEFEEDTEEGTSTQGAWLKVLHLKKCQNYEDKDAHNDNFVQELVYKVESSKPKQEFTRSLFGSPDDYPVDATPDNAGESSTGTSEDEFTEKDDVAQDTPPNDSQDQWEVKTLSFSHEQDAQKVIEISAYALDCSNLALLSLDEDLYFKQSKGHSKSISSDLPGRSARLFAVGTSTGSIFVWNIRLFSGESTLQQPLRIIHTESPAITTIGLTSLYLIHGGSDGLVQCWDPLSSTVKPIRTIHSKFASRARRQMTQMNAINHGEQGDNQYAARAVCLDPDPTVLRGAVALGTLIRYWSFAGDVSSQINGRRKKTTVRKAGVGGGGTGRVKAKGGISGEISAEAQFLQTEKEEMKRRDQRLRDRFGLEGAEGLNEEEMLVYARMLSEEAFEADKAKSIAGAWDTNGMTQSWSDIAGQHNSEYDTSLQATSSTTGSSSQTSLHTIAGEEELDDSDLAEAIRLSLLETTPGAGVSYRYAYGDRTPNIENEASSMPNSIPFHAPTPPMASASNGHHGQPVGGSSSSTLSDSFQPQSPAADAGTSSGYRDEWPSPRRAAMILEEKLDDGILDGGLDDDLAYAISLSLAEEESRRLVESGGMASPGAGVDGGLEGATQSGKSKGKPRNGKGKWRG